MTTLNLIHPEYSDLRYKTMVFPDGQPHLKLDMESIDSINRQQPVRILARLTNGSDLLMVLFAKKRARLPGV